MSTGYRLIESTRQKCDVTGEQAERILAAIYRGEQVSSNALYRGPLHEVAKEVAVTKFVDPGSGDTRWAVEVWSGSKKWTRDYAEESRAISYRDRELDRLGI